MILSRSSNPNYSMCWLSYKPIGKKEYVHEVEKFLGQIVLLEKNIYFENAANELKKALCVLFETELRLNNALSLYVDSGIILGKVTNENLRGFITDVEKEAVGEEGFIIKLVDKSKKNTLLLLQRVKRNNIWDISFDKQI